MSKEYDEYLREHIDAVRKAAEWIVENLETVGDFYKSEFMFRVSMHDDSKWNIWEYGPYDAYFYGNGNKDDFNRAWLRHIHNNPHHWQHWLLMNDDGKLGDPGKVVAIEMPKVYALEMVADWWSFSWRAGNLEDVFDWYEEHRDNIILHPKTREFVESVLDEIREKLADE